MYIFEGREEKESEKNLIYLKILLQLLFHYEKLQKIAQMLPFD